MTTTKTMPLLTALILLSFAGPINGINSVVQNSTSTKSKALRMADLWNTTTDNLTQTCHTYLINVASPTKNGAHHGSDDTTTVHGYYLYITYCAIAVFTIAVCTGLIGRKRWWQNRANETTVIAVQETSSDDRRQEVLKLKSELVI